MNKSMLLSTQQLVDSYKLRKMGASYPEIHEKTGASNIWNIMDAMNRHNEGRMKNKSSLSNNYEEAVKILRKEGYLKEPIVNSVQVNPLPPSPETIQFPNILTSSDPFELLQFAFDNFTASIGEFIETQVDNKVATVKKELAEQKEINNKLITTMEEAKNDNWVSALKKKFG